jgi:beta-lactamase class D
MSTFKIPHAIAALDAGVLDGPEATLRYDGSRTFFPEWARDHTLASAMRYSVLWYFQRVAERLGAAREQEYVRKLNYGNRDSSSGLTTFWLGGSLLISPEEQQQFLLRLYRDELPVGRKATQIVREILVQPAGVVVNAAGAHPFAAPWPDGTIVSAKTGGGGYGNGKDVRWVVGHIQRANRSWVFVSCVAGESETGALAAIELAARELRDAHVL